MSGGIIDPLVRPLAGPGDIISWAAARYAAKKALITTARELTTASSTNCARGPRPASWTVACARAR